MTIEPQVSLLIVDDDEDDLYLVKDALSEVAETRYRVTTASSPLGAMAKLAEDSFDVIISDYRLGAVTGIDFMKSVRAAGIDTPFILLTGVAAQMIDRAALEAGASDFLPKTSLNPVVIDRSVRYAIAHAQRQRLLQAVLKSSISGVAVLDEAGALSLWNPRFGEFAQMAFAGEADRLKRLAAQALETAGRDIEIGAAIVEAHRTDLAGGGTLLVLHDVTARVHELQARQEAESQIRKIALFDTLTGLPNRAAFNVTLDALIDEINDPVRESRLAVLSFDFNKFKDVNDHYGHAAGDKLLRVAAQRLLDLMTGGEHAARLGGDEFVMIQQNASEATATELARRVIAGLSEPFEWDGRLLDVGLSVGIAMFPEHGRRREELLANADIAMYRAKSGQTDGHCLFTAGMGQAIRDRRALEIDLKHAIENDELFLNFQPQFDIATGALSGFESLVRWRNAARGFVSPGEFIPLAEENGMIRDIDRMVLRKACAAAAGWPRPLRIAVNISARAICQSGIVDDVMAVLLATGLSASRLELEVTETAFINDLNRALHNLRQLKALGIAIAMDDFGTGFSSLSLLNTFPFDRIKIDGSFIQSVGANSRAEAIFRAIMVLGDTLKVPVLVEGVETRSQYDFAAAHGCDEIQGYFTGRPLLEADAVRLMDPMAPQPGFEAVPAPAVRYG